jgi:hypothetical protein|nr:MAG TPA: Glycine rich protein [Bacteriophage sp.]
MASIDINEGDVFDFAFQNYAYQWIPDIDCKIKIELWGAGGGANTGLGGNGGYSVGEVSIKKDTILWINVGEKPSGYKGGYNGGGDCAGNLGSGGGGATDVRVGSASLYHRLIVAGGGGGGCISSYKGGAGGGTEGLRGESMGTDGEYSGNGGTQTAGGIGYTPASSGLFGQGGKGYTTHEITNATYSVGGGGGGWFGGSGGHFGNASGSGGSGYVLTASSFKPSGYMLGSEYYMTNASTSTRAYSGQGKAKITVLETAKPTVTKIEIFTSPKTIYRIGESFVEQGIIQVTYSDNSQLLVPITSNLLTGFDTSSVGTKTVTITYAGVTTTYDITIIGVTNMVFTEQPITEYKKNDTFIQKGLISVTWSDTNIESVPLTSDMLSGFDTSSVGTKTVTVNYYNGSLTYDIEVSNIVSVEIEEEPITNYKLFDTFKDGGTLKVTYEGGKAEYVNITRDIVQNFNTDTVGYNLVTLNYAGFRVSYMILVMVDEISCVFDRTLEDVTYAFNNQTSVSKGALNYEDLNRIEGNIDILVLTLSTIGYYLRLDIKTDWEETDIPTYVEMNRIRNNIRKLIIKFVEIGIFPQVEDLYYLDYTEVNNWERILCQLFMGYKNYLETIIYCGTRYCGE